jgi:peptidoglycan/LPS O-acetylase OafA/YrhL
MTHHPPHLAHLKYRPDIDGLRAIAILAVVIFHAFPGKMPGGFIGVDIFFVISGFLISTNIFSSLERDRFSLVEFYVRRVRRIFPALILVLISCLAFGWFVLFADEFKQLGEHTAAGAGFIQNFILWRESGYFDNTAETKPLLHLWTLAIEEQFYIFWPLLLVFVWKRQWNFLRLTAFIAAVSFIANIFLILSGHSAAAFYLPFSRFWELMVGCALAYIVLHRPQLIENHKGAQSFLGFALILAGFLLINKGRDYPGWWALLPTLGSFFIISAGPSSWLNEKLLANKPIVLIGLISYPLYLWHWPLLSFSQIIEGEIPSKEFRLVVLSLAVGLAWLTYRFVEKPFRFGIRTEVSWAILLILLSLVGTIGFILKQSQIRLPNDENLLSGDTGYKTFFSYQSDKFHRCTPDSIASRAEIYDGYLRCLQSKNGNAGIALIGDSHAEHLFIGLSESMPDQNIVYYLGNPPFLSNPDFSKIVNSLADSKSVKKVVYAMFFVGRVPDIPQGSSLDAEILKTAKMLIDSGKEVYLTTDIPNFRFNPNKCMRLKKITSTNANLQCDDIVDRSDKIVAMLRSVIKKEPRIHLIDTFKLFCASKICSMKNGNELLYRDNNHLNIKGSQFVGRAIVGEISRPTSAE